MTYVAAYQDPDFSQTLPEGVAWDLVGSAYFGALEYRNAAGPGRAVVPNIWYNQTVDMRAKALRFSADQSDASAARCEADAASIHGKPWDLDTARHHRAQAARLRALADEMVRTGRVLA